MTRGWLHGPPGLGWLHGRLRLAPRRLRLAPRRLRLAPRRLRLFPWWIGPVLAAMLLPGCAKRTDKTMAPPDGQVGDDLAALEQQLAAREDQLRSSGVSVPLKEAQLSAKSAGGEEGPAPTTPSPEAMTNEPDTAAGDAAPAPSEAPRSNEKTEARGGRCMQVCEISAAICTLQDQICGLLPRHRDDPRYQAACDRAAADCQISTEACHGCSDT
jgi:hypothetical protein